MEIADSHAFERAWDRVQELTDAIEDSLEEKELVELINAMEEYEREHAF
ncbi:hypothetical protein AB4Z10_29670 [Bosea sp. RAF48]|jgi:hypothetical protein